MAASTERMKTLVKRKDDLESEIKELHSLLDSQKSVGTDGPLIDTEGFPRSDIDVYSVRHARHQIARLQNDHQEVMREIEEELISIHAQARQRLSSREEDMEVDKEKPEEKPLEAIARIDRVDANSPAAQGGFEVEDEVIIFGSVTADNFTGLQSIGSLVQHSKDKALSVTVRRQGKVMRLSLTPKTWSGRGLLGCNIVPTKR
ncbi:26S proteasome non-ATPase regulatory subunit 9-like [Haliotis rufescens]|uniref:26S proteasome non-ATPase regulatory subunit 9-like n=1 Tax=Haliotis rufescens TaxID=6454 RepID=UPI00201EB7B5|nr:26S proteasome non-ATPase regulatory subunit 9-like [Haliotis rufescens]